MRDKAGVSVETQMFTSKQDEVATIGTVLSHVTPSATVEY